ncbi:hypothetical protein EYM_06450 [Ignicoccus islandicus DSM 13165]|uniref:Uncharacterized protein n=1 Tax=Ignicoccus islandicus DSM 13165 TaxID=940295 RepID=A0A0U3EBI8_9CREN|nr:hypothetical protein [Ignicoccus islandicus]ALU12686.1 hypothetical protein EYM_06450 [Ignicoccus islandicus DSM 13165]
MIAPCSAKVSVSKDDIYLEVFDMDSELSLDIDLTSNVVTFMQGSKFKSFKVRDEEILDLGERVTDVIRKECELVSRENNVALYTCICGISKEITNLVFPFLGNKVKERSRRNSSLTISLPLL